MWKRSGRDQNKYLEAERTLLNDSYQRAQRAAAEKRAREAAAEAEAIRVAMAEARELVDELRIRGAADAESKKAAERKLWRLLWQRTARLAVEEAGGVNAALEVAEAEARRAAQAEADRQAAEARRAAQAEADRQAAEARHAAQAEADRQAAEAEARHAAQAEADRQAAEAEARRAALAEDRRSGLPLHEWFAVRDQDLVDPNSSGVETN